MCTTSIMLSCLPDRGLWWTWTDVSERMIDVKVAGHDRGEWAIGFANRNCDDWCSEKKRACEIGYKQLASGAVLPHFRFWTKSPGMSAKIELSRGVVVKIVLLEKLDCFACGKSKIWQLLPSQVATLIFSMDILLMEEALHQLIGTVRLSHFLMVLYIAGGAGIFPSNKMIDLVQNHGRKAEHKETFADRNCMKVCTSRWQSECHLERNSRTKNVYMQSRPPNGIIFQSEASQLTFSLVVRYGVSHVYFIVRVATLRNQPTISHHTMWNVAAADTKRLNYGSAAREMTKSKNFNRNLKDTGICRRDRATDATL